MKRVTLNLYCIGECFKDKINGKSGQWLYAVGNEVGNQPGGDYGSPGSGSPCNKITMELRSLFEGLLKISNKWSSEWEVPILNIYTRSEFVYNLYSGMSLWFGTVRYGFSDESVSNYLSDPEMRKELPRGAYTLIEDNHNMLYMMLESGWKINIKLKNEGWFGRFFDKIESEESGERYWVIKKGIHRV